MTSRYGGQLQTKQTLGRRAVAVLSGQTNYCRTPQNNRKTAQDTKKDNHRTLQESHSIVKDIKG